MNSYYLLNSPIPFNFRIAVDSDSNCLVYLYCPISFVTRYSRYSTRSRPRSVIVASKTDNCSNSKLKEVSAVRSDSKSGLIDFCQKARTPYNSVIGLDFFAKGLECCSDSIAILGD